ncbi:MAG: cell division protein PerM [Candidatus Nanopelagicaceae bacterium]
MFQRVLLVSLSQVLRSISLVLLPIAFLALIAWATAGSITGNTSDPIRAALWVWLGVHNIPFALSIPPAGAAGFLSYLPLGGLLFPFMAIRSSFSRIVERLDRDTNLINVSRLHFTIIYTLIAELVIFASKTDSIKPVWYSAIAILIPGVYLTTLTVGKKVTLTQPVNLGTRIVALLLAISAIFLSISLFINLSTVKDLITVLRPGIIGGLLLLVINIVYLPNAAVATMAYLSGTGFGVGTNTLVSPLEHTVVQIPALPILGALPSTEHPQFLFSIFFFVMAGALLASWNIASKSKVLLQSYFVSIITIFILTYFASGSLLTNEMSTVGPSLWKFPLSVAIEMGLGIVMAIFIPRISLPTRKSRING